MKLFCTVLFILGALTMASGCGPVNERPQQDEASDSLNTLKGAGASLSSKTGAFYVSGCLGPGTEPLQKAKSVAIGDHELVFRVVNTTTLEPLSPDAEVRVELAMPEMPEHHIDEQPGKATRTANGFRVSAFFGMAGMWSIQVTIRDGSLQDTLTYVVYAQN